MRAVPRSDGLRLLACLLVGLPIGFDMQLIGRITGTEVMMVLLPVALVLGKVPPLTWPIRNLVVLVLVWLGAQYLSDVVNESTLDDTMRGAARAGITVILIVGFFTIIADRLRNLQVLFAAMAVGLLIGSYFNPPEAIESDVWKFGYGNGVTMLVVAVAAVLWKVRQRPAAVALCFAICVLNLWLGYRSLAGVVFLTGLLLGLSMLLGSGSRNFSTVRLVAIILAVYVGGAGLIELWAGAAREGLLGVGEQEKYFSQVDERGVLLSGRSELPVALAAVREKPLLGHGSWAMNEQYSTLLWEMSGFNTNDMSADNPDLIPTHSHLMGAWVEGGILAAAFWFYVIFILLRAVATTVRNSALAEPIILFTLMNLGWAVLFSPYGLTNRVLGCFAIVVAATVLRLNAAAPVSPKEARR